MKKKNKKIVSDNENLFGLLISYKTFYTYFKIIESKSENIIAIMLSDNPKKWEKIYNEKYKKYREFRRIELGIDKRSLKYLLPGHIVNNIGNMLGIDVPKNKVKIFNKLNNEGYYILEISIKEKQKVFYGIRQLLSLKPQKRYEILEKSLLGTNQEEKDERTI